MPIQYYEYHTNPERWSDELRLASKPGGRFHWLGGLYWEKTVDKNSGSTYFMPGLQYQTVRRFSTTTITQLPEPHRCPPDSGTPTSTRTDYLQTTEFANISFDITDKLNVEAGVVHFHSDSPATPRLMASSLTHLRFRAVQRRVRNKWDSKFGINYKLTDKVMVYADLRAGLPRRRHQLRLSAEVLQQRRAASTTRLTRSTISKSAGKPTSLNGHLVWNGAAYLMNWKQLQTHHLRREHLRLQQLQRQRR